MKYHWRHSFFLMSWYSLHKLNKLTYIKKKMNIYSLQLLIIFICYLNTLVFMVISCFSCFICSEIGLFWFAIIWFFQSQGLWLALMPINIMQWRVEIRIFNIRFYLRFKSNALGPLTPLLCTIAGISIKLLSLFLLLCGDVELNPGPNKKLLV